MGGEEIFLGGEGNCLGGEETFLVGEGRLPGEVSCFLKSIIFISFTEHNIALKGQLVATIFKVTELEFNNSFSVSHASMYLTGAQIPQSCLRYN